MAIQHLRRRARLGWTVLVCSLIALLFSSSVFADEARPEARKAFKYDLSPPLKDMPRVPFRTKEQKVKEIPDFVRPGWLQRKFQGPDPVLQDWGGSKALFQPTINFEGVNNLNAVLPPDPNGDVGPNHYVQMVNLSFAIWDKQGTLLFGPVDNNTLWQGFGTPCDTENRGDPIVLYDHLADRWLMSQFGFDAINAGPYYQCIAISQTPDPTGKWHRYAFLVSSTKFNDYPKIGVWPDGYYMTLNQFDCIPSGCSSFVGTAVVAFERSRMLSGLSAQMVYIDLEPVDPTVFGMLPSDLDGTSPPAGEENTFMAFTDSPDELELWDFDVNWVNPLLSTFTPTGTLPVAAFDPVICTATRGRCIDQPGTTRRLEAFSDRLMHRLQYRNFGTHETLVTNHTVDVGVEHAGIRWYELRRTGSSWAVHQQGTYAPDSDHRWMGSIAMNGQGDMALGFTVSSTSTFPSIRYVGRLAGDPLGTLPITEETLIAGGGSQTSTFRRWGDYSMMAVDPVDDQTFWFTHEYYSTTSDLSWQTRIGAFLLPDCSPPASGDWVVTESCTFEGTDTAPANVIVENNAVLTIAAGAELDIDFATYQLLVKDGSGVLIEATGKID